MLQSETVLALLVVMVALVTVSRRIGIPYPVLLVVGGLVLIPGLPRVVLAPSLVFLLFLPPLLLEGAQLLVPRHADHHARDRVAGDRPGACRIVRGGDAGARDDRGAYLACGLCARRDRLADRRRRRDGGLPAPLLDATCPCTSSAAHPRG